MEVNKGKGCVVYSEEVLNFPPTILAHPLSPFNPFQGHEQLDLITA